MRLEVLAGATYAPTFPDLGRYANRCPNRPGMAGVVDVA